LTVWDGQGKQIGRFQLAHRIAASALSPKGRWLAACSAGEAVHGWSLPEGKPVGKFESGDSRHVDHIAFSHDDRLLLTGDSLRGTQIWDIGSQRRVAEFSDSEHHAHSLATSPIGPLWAAANGARIRVGALPAP
jgi:WD40 repeat protein